MLDAQRREFDAQKRLQLGYEIQRYLLGVGNTSPGSTLPPAVHARLDYAAPGGGGISWPYLKHRTSFPWFGSAYLASCVWIDKSDPSYSGRPA